jgi:hypothetical protein
MSLHVHLRGPGLNMITSLKEGALDELLAFLQTHRDTESGPPCWPLGPGRGLGGRSPGAGRPEFGPGEGRRKEPLTEEQRTQRQEAVRTMRKNILAATPSAAASMKKLEALAVAPLAAEMPIAEKMLLLGAWTEARKEKFLARGPLLVEALVKAGQSAPANARRDFNSALEAGWFVMGQFPNPQRALLTAAGWTKVAELLSE